MPTVTNTVKTNVVKAKAAVANLITQKELAEASQLMKELAPLEEQYKEKCKKLEKLQLSIFQRALGMKQESEWKPLNPDQIAAIIQTRFTTNVAAVEAGKMDFGIACTNIGKYVGWKAEFINVAGEAKANAIQEAQAPSHTYKLTITESE